MRQFIKPLVRKRGTSALLCGALLAAAAACAASDAVREYVDASSGVSVTVTTEAMIFARERLDLAANARDYITLAPLEVNRSGQRSYFWLGYLWSTIDRRKSEPMVASGDALVLFADGRPIRLVPDDTPLPERGVVQPPLPVPKRNAIPVLFTIDPESIAYVSRASDLRIQLVHEDTTDTFSLWKDARAAVRGFAERAGID